MLKQQGIFSSVFHTILHKLTGFFFFSTCFKIWSSSERTFIFKQEVASLNEKHFLESHALICSTAEAAKTAIF